MTDDCGDNSDEMGTFCEEHTFLQSTFEDEDQPFGEFEPAAPSSFQWQRRTGETANPGTGAAIDHTLYDAAGHYLFINSSQEDAQEGKKAEIASKVFKPGFGDDNECEIIFYYHMHGPNVGRFRVIVDGENGKKILFKREGDQGNKWIRQKLIVRNSTDHGLYNVVFEASIGGHGGGDIALDDVVFTYNCKLRNDDSTTPSPSPDNLKNCSFEDKNLCGWKIDEQLNVTDRFHFERINGDEVLLRAGRPDRDHDGKRASNVIMHDKHLS